MGIAMGRTSISLAIVALLLCGRTLGQSTGPQGERVAQGIVTPTPVADTPGTAVPTPEILLPAPGAVLPTTEETTQPTSGTVPTPEAMPTGQPMLQAEPEMSSFVPDSIGNSWNQQPPMGEANPFGVGPCCALCGGGKCCPKDWYVNQRIRIMTHPRPRDIIFSSWHTQQTFPTASGDVTVDVFTPAISTRTTPFNLSASYEITLGRYLGLDTDNRNHFLEFMFYGTNHWGAGIRVISSADESAAFNVTSPDEFDFGTYGNLNGGRSSVAGFNRADRQWAEYRSSLNNFEVNLRMVPRSRSDRLVLHKNGKWRRECQRGVVCSWLAGVRLFTMDEYFDFHSSSTIEYFHNSDQDTSYDTNVATGTYRTTANNGLLGLQVGPEWIFRQCRAEFGMGARAAAYINFAEQQTWINVTGASGDVFSDGQDIDLHRSLSRNGSAVSIQLDFNASYKVRPNFILKASYELLYMGGLVLAPEQVNMAFDESISINNGGTLLLQSGRLGFEYLW